MRKGGIMTGAATWEQIMFVLAAIGGVMGAAWILWSRIESARAASRQEIEAVRTATTIQVDALRATFHDFQLNVAERYATHEAILNFDKRVMQAVGDVKTDFNRRFDDMQHMVQTVINSGRPG
jgi:hypothetical protein